MRYLLVILFLKLFLFADSYYQVTGSCIQDNYYINESNALCYVENNQSNYTCDTTAFNASSLYSGFLFDTETLTCKRDLPYGLERLDYNFLTALSGLLLGFVFSFMVIFIFLRRRLF